MFRLQPNELRPDTMMAPLKTGYAPANGVELYYEVYGSGDPIIVLHGGLGSIEMMTPVSARLAAGSQVIAFDLQGHGRSGDTDRPLQFADMADDLALALDHLGLVTVDLMGYSLGAGVAFQLALRSTARVRRLALVSFPFCKSGWFPEVNQGMSHLGAASVAALSGSPIHELYCRVAPEPKRWPSLHAKLHDLLTQDYDWSDAIGNIKAPTLIVAGDADSMSPLHMGEFYRLLGGGQRDGGWDGSAIGSSRLAVLPGATHYNIIAQPLLTDVVEAFFNTSD